MRKWNKNSTTTIDMPQTQPYGSRRYSSEILAATLSAILIITFGCMMAGILIQFTDYLLEDLILWIGKTIEYSIYGVGLLITLKVLNSIYNSFAEGRHQRKLELKELNHSIQQTHHRMQTMLPAITGAKDNNKRDQLILALVTDALEFNEHNFSFRKAGAYVLAGTTEPVGKGSPAVADALAWLQDKNCLIKAGQTHQLHPRITSYYQVQELLHSPAVLHVGTNQTVK